MTRSVYDTARDLAGVAAGLEGEETGVGHDSRQIGYLPADRIFGLILRRFTATRA